MKEGKISEQDVGFMEDAIGYISNATAAEEHCLDAYGIALSKGKKDDAEIFMELAKTIRRRRAVVLERIASNGDYPLYCITKHLSRMVMGEEELGNRYSEEDNKKLAEECFEHRALWESTIMLINEKLKGGKK